MESKTTFHQAVDIAWRLERICRKKREDMEAKKSCDFGGFSGAYFGGKGRYGRGYASRPVQSTLQISRGASANQGFQSTRTWKSYFIAPPACGSYMVIPVIMGRVSPCSHTCREMFLSVMM